MNKEQWALQTLFTFKDNVDTEPDFQRPAVWTLAQKQLLIDTILRGFDVPKLYWRKTSNAPPKYEVVDGQQRTRAITEFMGNGFHTAKNADPVEGYAIAGSLYNDMPPEMQLKLQMYSLDVVVMGKETSEDEVRDMFLRLQNGTPLNAQEKRNAQNTNIRDTVKRLAQHPFYKSVQFKNTRYAHDLAVAQLMCIELSTDIPNIKNADLNHMYETYKDKREGSKEAKKVSSVLSTLRKVFPEKSPELSRYNVVSLYCMVARLLDEYVIKDVQKQIYEWFINFEKTRGEEKHKEEDKQSAEWLRYQEQLGHSNDGAVSIKHRVDFMFEKLFLAHPNVRQKDTRRNFTHEQRKAIFRKDNCRCQVKIKCDGTEKLKWENWESDHKKPYANGGATTVENGQVSCRECNRAKSDSE